MKRRNVAEVKRISFLRLAAQDFILGLALQKTACTCRFPLFHMATRWMQSLDNRSAREFAACTICDELNSFKELAGTFRILPNLGPKLRDGAAI